MTIAMPRPPHRLERLRAWMEDEQVACTVAFGTDHVAHLCDYVRYFGGPSAVVVGCDGERTLVVMRDEEPVAREQSAADRVLGCGERGFGLDLDPVLHLVATVAEQPAVAGAARLGVVSEIAGAEARLASAVSATPVEARAALDRIRLVKDWDELKKIGFGYELCWRGQEAVADGVKRETSEIELFTAAQAAAQVAAGGPIEFVCDLLSGPNSAEVCCPVRVAGRRVVAPGDAVVADVVVRSNGYWGDSAETHVAGSNREAEAVRHTLLDILADAGRELLPGATGAEVFGRMRERILDAFPDGEFPHHGGHALGLTSFEDPHVIPSDTTPFEPWMVLALEPGVYFAGRFGARVENVFVVSADGGVELREALAGAPDAGAADGR